MLTERGYIKTVAADAFRSQARGGRGITGTKLKDEDFVTHMVHTSAHAYLLFFSNRGKVYRLKAHRIPMRSGPRRASRWSTCCGSDPTSASRRSSTRGTTRRTATCSS